MRISEYTKFLRSRNADDNALNSALETVKDFEEYLTKTDRDIDSVQIHSVKDYFTALIADEKNTMQRFRDLARYFYVTGQNEVYIYIISTISGREVFESISEKLVSKKDTDCRDRVFDGLEAPPLGSPPDTYPGNTCLLANRLMELGSDTCHEVLADNHHGIPHDSFQKHLQWFEESDSIDSFLKRVHVERIRILQQHLDDGKAWFEQEITPEVIELVKGNQEILSAVRDGKYLYVTKIPYSPKDWLKETDSLMKRYYACHCPLAREAIIMNGPDIPMDWCYCSGGFQKLMFDVVFGESTHVEVLQSVLAGDPVCRFRISLPEKMIPDDASSISS
ncbi:MAG: hypothetical protein GQ565_04145 [Candidatus Aegiribacteria sp.]|nr:hypothetical protein [Candidatus Aegiribacteria sp.]